MIPTGIIRLLLLLSILSFSKHNAYQAPSSRFVGDQLNRINSLTDKLLKRTSTTTQVVVENPLPPTANVVTPMTSIPSKIPDTALEISKTMNTFQTNIGEVGASWKYDANTVLSGVVKSVDTFMLSMTELLKSNTAFTWIVKVCNDLRLSLLEALQSWTIDLTPPDMGSYMDNKAQVYALLSTIDFESSWPLIAVPSALGLKAYLDEKDAPEKPYPSGRYDANDAANYFKYRSGSLFVRSVQLLSQSFGFALNLLGDYFRKKLFDEKQEEMRASQLTDLLTRLGPSFIKAGQSLSIRTDLLRPAYAKALSKLQDRVPSFPTPVARQIIEDELGKGVEQLFASGLEASASTVAAASLGQVYRVRLIDGTEAAVKVQRPHIVEQAALDMHLIRQAAPTLKRIFGLNSDLVGLVDEWATGFISELDYSAEASNAEEFSQSILTTPLGDKVFAPQVLREFSSKKVLTTRWVDGVKIEKIHRDDAASFCALAMNSYLTMMLETGVLHADPHPGNLFVTPDGKLCILDWGLVTRLDGNLQAAFIEHIAHLTSKDYAAIPGDLVKLGFISAGMEQLASEAGVVEVLTSVYSQLAGGGGAKKINVAAVVDELTSLTGVYGNLFQVPAYFAYIARAFGVLEGIGLTYDPDYAIIGECLPYISQRLLADRSEDTGKALGTFIFGSERDSHLRVVDAERFEMLLEGYGRYALSSTQGIAAVKKGSTMTERAEAFTLAILDLLLTESEQLTPLQTIIVEELAKVISALGRTAFTTVKLRSGTLPNGRSLIGTLLDPFNVLPMSLLFDRDEQDAKVLKATRSLIETARSSAKFDDILQDVTPLEAQRLASAVVQRLLSRRQELVLLVRRLSRKMLVQNQPRIDRANVPLLKMMARLLPLSTDSKE